MGGEHAVNKLLRRRRTGAEAGGIEGLGLPAEFQELAYIAYSGKGKYLWTNIPAAQMTSIVADIEKTGLPSTNSGSVFPAVKDGNAANANIWGTLENVSGSKFTASPSFDKTDIFRRTTVSSVRTQTTTTQVVGLGYNAAAFCPSLRFYSLAVYNGSSLLFRGVPCYRKSDGEIGMFDTVSRSFFPTIGTWTKGEYL